MSLTDQQISYFKTFGFLKLPGSFVDEINLIDNSFEKIYANVVAEDPSKRHDDDKNSSVPQTIVLAKTTEEISVAWPDSRSVLPARKGHAQRFLLLVETDARGWGRARGFTGQPKTTPSPHGIRPSRPIGRQSQPTDNG